MVKKTFTENKSFYRTAVILIVLIRLALNAVIPLMDQTEARYGEIARIMAETDDWVTPQIDYGFPFWAKPPLSTWLSAASIKLFGVNEFAVRFPSFVISLLILLLLKPFAREKGMSIWLAAFVLFTIPEFLLHMGVVSTDMSLVICMTLMMIAFWNANHKKAVYWQYLFFAGIGLGLLAKGPIVLILTVPPVFVWLLWFNQWRPLWKNFHWLSGVVIIAAIALPWYYLAERRTPGFLDYFFVGEHFKRFLDSSWKGDKYGFPKQQPLGIIWIFLFGLAFPWIYTVTGKLWKNRHALTKNSWVAFLLLWLVWTPMFFTVSKSLIHTYIMPVMPPLALLTVYYWEEIKRKKLLICIALVVPALSFVLAVLAVVPGVYENNSNTDKYILQHSDKSLPLYFLGDKSYSSRFYSNGKVKSIDKTTLQQKLNSGEEMEVIIPKKAEFRFGSDDNGWLIKESEGRKNILYRSGRRTLLD